MDKPVCGFVGLGSQGAPIARRMVDSGLRVLLWARRPATLEPFEDTAAEFAGSLAEMGAQADHVGICVLDDAGVEQVCGELLPAMRPGGRIAIHSTIHPDTCKRMAAAAAARDIGLIDAPVSGGAPAAEAGTLTLMLGGDRRDIEAAMPVFRTFGQLIVHLGEVGAGQQVKLINNSLLAANLALAQAAFDGGTELGIDRSALSEILLASSGRSFGVEVTARLPAPSAFKHGAALLDKDLRLLGEVLGENSKAWRVFSDAASPFIRRALD